MINKIKEFFEYKNEYYKKCEKNAQLQQELNDANVITFGMDETVTIITT